MEVDSLSILIKEKQIRLAIRSQAKLTGEGTGIIGHCLPGQGVIPLKECQVGLKIVLRELHSASFLYIRRMVDGKALRNGGSGRRPQLMVPDNMGLLSLPCGPLPANDRLSLNA